MAMQSDEMKAIRKSLGMTQAAFGEAIGLSRVRINLMEAGKEAISARTEKTVNALLSSGTVDRNLVDGCLATMIERLSTALADPAASDVILPREEAALLLGLLQGMADTVKGSASND